MTVVKIVALQNDLHASILRDLLKLCEANGSFSVIAPEDLNAVVRLAGLTPVAKGKANLTIHYSSEKFTQAYLNEHRENSVFRCFAQQQTPVHYGKGANPFLPQQGRRGANLTELYLSRQHPTGRGVVDPFVLSIS